MMAVEHTPKIIRESFLHVDHIDGEEGSFVVKEQPDGSCKYFHLLCVGHSFIMAELSTIEFIGANSDRKIKNKN